MDVAELAGAVFGERDAFDELKTDVSNSVLAECVIPVDISAGLFADSLACLTGACLAGFVDIVSPVVPNITRTDLFPRDIFENFHGDIGRGDDL